MRRNVLTTLLLALALIIPSLPLQMARAADTDAAGGDWPQLQYDAQRSGAAPRAVPGPYRFYWRWNEAPLASRAQPVVAAGRLFIGSINGRVYALDADADSRGGPPTKLWTRDLGSPIRSGGAVAGNILIISTHSGIVYGLNVATGAPVWRFLTGAPVLAAPLVAGKLVYVGSTSGVLFALDHATGAMRWNYRAGWPILSAPALSADGTRVFFAAEDIAAYAVDATTGNLVWRTPLQGQGTGDRWPVVSGNTVIFRTQPLRHFRDLIFRGDATLDRGGDIRGNWAEDWAAVRGPIVEKLTAEPDQQSFFALNVANGSSRGIAPVLYTGGSQENPALPTIDDDGSLLLFLRPRRGIQNDSPVAVHIASKYDADPAAMHPVSLAVSGIEASNEFGYQWRATSDEGAHLSMAGRTLLISSWERLGAIDLVSKQNIGIAQVAHNYPGCGSQCQANNNLMPFFPPPTAPSSPSNAEGASRTPVVVAAGRLFWRVGESGLASIGPSSGRESETESDASFLNAIPEAPPVEEPPPAQTQAAVDLRSYITAAPTAPNRTPPADLAQRLEVEALRIIAADDHLKPLFIQRGWSTNKSWPPDSANPSDGTTQITHNSSMVTGNAYWYDPGELIYTLSMIYPYLTPATQAKLKTYLREEIARYGPFDNLPFGDLPWLRKGVSRTGYSLPFESELSSWPPPAPPIQTLYAIWAYGEYVGEWEYVQANWDRIDDLWDARKGSVDSYARIAGAIGYYRIAQRLGRSAAAAEAVEVGNAALNAGLDFNAFRSRANQLFPDMELQIPKPLGTRAPVFFGLTPEVGRFLTERLRAQVNAEVTRRTSSAGAPLWFATQVGNQDIEPSTEQSFHGPDLAWGLFLARAYAQGADQGALRSILDRPWAMGDLYYLQKVVAVIQAPAGSATTAAPTVSAVSVERASFAGVVLRWRTNQPASGWIEYGPTRNYGRFTPIWLAPVEEHRITLDNLEPKRTYHYRVCSTSAGGTTCSPNQTFTTANASKIFLPLIVK